MKGFFWSSIEQLSKGISLSYSLSLSDGNQNNFNNLKLNCVREQLTSFIAELCLVRLGDLTFRDPQKVGLSNESSATSYNSLKTMQAFTNTLGTFSGNLENIIFYKYCDDKLARPDNKFFFLFNNA